MKLSSDSPCAINETPEIDLAEYSLPSFEHNSSNNDFLPEIHKKLETLHNLKLLPPLVSLAIDTYSPFRQVLLYLKNRNELSRALFVQAVSLYESEQLLLSEELLPKIVCSKGRIWLLSIHGERISLAGSLLASSAFPPSPTREESRSLRASLPTEVCLRLRAAASSEADSKIMDREISLLQERALIAILKQLLSQALEH